MLRGSIVTSPTGVGIVSRTDATPGLIVPYIALAPSRSRCGHRTMLMRQAHPIVTLAHAFVHDAPAQRGDLLVDADGLPLGIHVSEQGGIGFAIPLTDALALF